MERRERGETGKREEEEMSEGEDGRWGVRRAKKERHKRTSKGLGVVAHTCNPSTLGG